MKFPADDVINQESHVYFREIWDKLTSFIFWNFEISLVSLGRFQNFQKMNSVNLSQISLINMWLLVQINDWYKVMAKSFCEDMTRNFRNFVGWFQLMANNFGCGHVNSTKICKNVSKGPIIKVANYEVQGINRKKVIKTYVGGGHFCPPPPHTE